MAASRDDCGECEHCGHRHRFEIKILSIFSHFPHIFIFQLFVMVYTECLVCFATFLFVGDIAYTKFGLKICTRAIVLRTLHV